MSSSRIIKSGRLQEISISTVSYGGVDATDEKGAVPESAFLPLNFSEHSARKEPVPPRGEDEPKEKMAPEAGIVMITEEELQEKLEAAFNKGIDEGRQQAERGLANVFRSLREAIDATMRLREKVLRDSEEGLLKLAISVARKVIQQEIQQDPQILAKIVAETVSCCSDLDKITIRLNPDDCNRVSANRHFYLSGIGANTQVSLIPDETVLPGGCMVDTITGTIDARIDVQLEEIYRRCLENHGLQDQDAPGEREETTP